MVDHEIVHKEMVYQKTFLQHYFFKKLFNETGVSSTYNSLSEILLKRNEYSINGSLTTGLKKTSF